MDVNTTVAVVYSGHLGVVVPEAGALARRFLVDPLRASVFVAGQHEAGEAVDTRLVWGRLRGLEPIALRSLTPKLTRAQLLAGLEASPSFATVRRHLRVRQTFRGLNQFAPVLGSRNAHCLHQVRCTARPSDARTDNISNLRTTSATLRRQLDDASMVVWWCGGRCTPTRSCSVYSSVTRGARPYAQRWCTAVVESRARGRWCTAVDGRLCPWPWPVAGPPVPAQRAGGSRACPTASGATVPCWCYTYYGYDQVCLLATHRFSAAVLAYLLWLYLLWLYLLWLYLLWLYLRGSTYYYGSTYR